MRTKTLLAAAAIVAAGALSSQAQNVYSLNVVGYVNTTVPANDVGNGFAIIANPLATADSDISAVIPPTSVPDGTTVYSWNSDTSSFVIRSRSLDDDDNAAWTGPLAIAPGNGFWIKNPSPTPLNITFVGEVLQGSLVNPIPTGFSMKSSMVPESGDLASVLEYPAVVDSTTIYFWRNASYTIRSRTLDDDDNAAWSGPTVPLVGEGFWVKEAAPRSWERNFTVAP